MDKQQGNKNSTSGKNGKGANELKEKDKNVARFTRKKSGKSKSKLGTKKQGTQQIGANRKGMSGAQQNSVNTKGMSGAQENSANRKGMSGAQENSANTRGMSGQQPNNENTKGVPSTQYIKDTQTNNNNNENYVAQTSIGSDKNFEKENRKLLRNDRRVRRLIQNARRKYNDLNNKPAIKGVKEVGKVFLKGTGKGLIRGAIQITGAITLGTIGLAAGISTGEFENAFSGAIGGIVAGSNIGKNVANRAITIPSRVAGVGREIKYTFNEGKYGEKEAEKRRKIREIKLSREYKDLLSKHQDKENEIDKFLNAGITNISKIRIALDNSNSYSTDNAIAYMNMAELCPTDIFEDREKFNVYLESHGIPKNKADEIYKAVRQFR